MGLVAQYRLLNGVDLFPILKCLRINSVEKSIHNKTLGPWTRELAGAHALINMNGRSVDCRYTPENKEAIYQTRIHSTHVLGQAIEGLDNPPSVWLNSSN